MVLVCYGFPTQVGGDRTRMLAARGPCLHLACSSATHDVSSTRVSLHKEGRAAVRVGLAAPDGIPRCARGRRHAAKTGHVWRQGQGEAFFVALGLPPLKSFTACMYRSASM